MTYWPGLTECEMWRMVAVFFVLSTAVLTWHLPHIREKRRQVGKWYSEHRKR